MRIFPYHLWRETQIFVAVQGHQVIGSVSLVCDGHSEGIPMESTYRGVVSNLRRENHAFGEACSLTVNSPDNLSNADLFGQLTRLMMFYARQVGLDYLIAVAHPRHAKFYRLAMGFQTIGRLTSYQQVGGQPGIPIMGRVNDRSSYRARWRRFYFDGAFADEELMPRPMNAVDRNFFREFLAQNARTDTRKAA